MEARQTAWEYNQDVRDRILIVQSRCKVYNKNDCQGALSKCHGTFIVLVQSCTFKVVAGYVVPYSLEALRPSTGLGALVSRGSMAIVVGAKHV